MASSTPQKPSSTALQRRQPTLSRSSQAASISEMIGEVKKLTWLSGKELFSHTLAVVVFVLAMALLIYILDLAFSSGFGALSNIKIG